MTSAKSGDTVRIHYTGTLDDGTQFDSSAGRDPLEFVLGQGQVIAGFDLAVEGMTAGEKKSVRIEPDAAYGHRQDGLTQEVPRSALPEDMQPEIGMGLRSQSPDGQVVDLVVTAVTAESITVDGNHPLAGQALSFNIELVSII
ncbi:MAG: peptidylprolyl isomerase [Pseudomonadota bacterium]